MSGRFQTVTQGELTDDDLAALARYQVNTIILHEDAFPEKVSPAPVGTTIRRLLAHPRLELLAHSGPVWSWRILPAPSEATPLPTFDESPSQKCEIISPARAWHFDPPFQPTPRRPLKAPLHKTASWMRETFRWQIVREDGSVETLPPGEEDARGTSWLRIDSGAPVRDLLFAPTPFVESRFLPAEDLFHEGFTVRDSGTGRPFCVDLSNAPAGSVAIHGPKLLLRESGRYAVFLHKVGDGTFRPPARIEVWLGNRLAATRMDTELGHLSHPETWLSFEKHDGDGPLDIRLVAGTPDDPDTPACQYLRVHGFHVRKIEDANTP